jgi:hypothetical protein
MGGRWHLICERINIFLWKGEGESRIRFRFFLCIRRIISAVRRLSLIVIGCHI